MYIIVGAGPSGLAAAYLLGRSGKRCIVVDRETEIGGCHRVLRFEGLFTEHAPRVYLSSYRNTLTLLDQMGIRDIFVSYRFSLFHTASKLIRKLTLAEILYLAISFILFLVKPYGEHVSVADWCCEFRAESKEVLDRFCRFTDGAGSDRYSIQKLFQIVNQNLFYNFLQPRLPNDVALFPQMRTAIEATGYVSFLLGHSVTRVLTTNDRVTGVVLSDGTTINCDKALLCVPPPSVHSILNSSNLLYPGVERMIRDSTYDTYLSATFHYPSLLDIESQWGFPVGEWGVISNRISDYTDLNDPRSRTVFSVTCVYLDRVSSRLQQTANQISDPGVVLEEIYHQLLVLYPELPSPPIRLLSPTAYYASGKWHERDSAFIRTVEGEHLDSRVEGVSGLYQIGTQNGNSSFSYTTFESAVTNAIAWANTEIEQPLVIHNPVPLRRVVWVVLILVVVYIVLKKRGNL